jgi:amino acid permease
MPTPSSEPPSNRYPPALRSLIWRVVVFFIAGVAVIGAFAIAWRLGAFAPPRP